MCCILCKISRKTNKPYLVLVVNDVFVSFDRLVIEKVAMRVGVSNLELASLGDGDTINI